MRPNDNFGLQFLCACAVIVLLTVGSAFARARAYERVTGKEISVWDTILLNPQVR